MKSLYAKFTGTTILIMIFSSLFSFVLSNIYYHYEIKPYNDKKNTNIALDVASYINGNENINLDSYLNSISSLGYQLYLYDEDGNEIYYGDSFRENTLPSGTKELVLNGEIYHGIAEFPKGAFVTGFFANELRNTIGVPVDYKNDKFALFLRPNIKFLINEMHMLLAWIIIFAIILSIIIVLVSTKQLIKPITKLTTATRKLSEGDFSIKLDIDRKDELGKLAKSFTQMAKQLEALDEMKSEFISNVSHDIQTPLANIKGYCNLLMNDSLSSDERKNYLVIVNDEIDRLSRLTKQLLLLTSLENEEREFTRQTFLLSEQIKEVINNFQWLINEKMIMVSYSLKDIYVNGNQAMLYNVWTNLLVNAIKYNREDGTINISVNETENDVVVSFVDTGIGLKENNLEVIFDRFYREDSSRTSSIEGSGLGLSIVKLVVENHGGKITVSSKKNVGSTFKVYLPKQKLT